MSPKGHCFTWHFEGPDNTVGASIVTSEGSGVLVVHGMLGGRWYFVTTYQRGCNLLIVGATHGTPVRETRSRGNEATIGASKENNYQYWTPKFRYWRPRKGPATNAVEAWDFHQLFTSTQRSKGRLNYGTTRASRLPVLPRYVVQSMQLWPYFRP